jgi:hypothetical protein
MQPTGEALESRELLTTAGYDFVSSGYRWSNPAHITYSIAPDGVFWDHGPNNLNATFNARFGNGAWQYQLARALATWESVANINITPTADSPLDLGTPGLMQGDPRFGDIRFGGYVFAGDNTTLAQSYFPPADFGTGSGDVEINTSMNWHIGSDFDLYSVMVHETGLTLGLNEPPSTSVVMNTFYHGVLSGLAPGDIAGIQSLYGPRTFDAYQAHGQGVGLSTAIDLTSSLGPARQALLANTSLATIGDTEYFTFVAPAAPGLGLQVTAGAGNVSMLSPKVTLMDASGNPIDVAANPGAWANNVTVGTNAVVPGQRYYVAVTGATNDVFAVGGYNLLVRFTGGPPISTSTFPPTPTPTPSPVPTPTPTPIPIPASPQPQVPPIAPDRFEPNNTLVQATRLGAVARPVTIAGLSLSTAGDVDDFVFTNLRAGVYQVSAAGTTVHVLDGSGRLIAAGSGAVAVRVFRPRTRLYVQITPPGGTPVANYALTIGTQVKKASPLPQHAARGARHPGRIPLRFFNPRLRHRR